VETYEDVNVVRHDDKPVKGDSGKSLGKLLDLLFDD
jgi:hypothetical protein